MGEDARPLQFMEREGVTMSNQLNIYVERCERLGITDKQPYYQIAVADNYDEHTIFLGWGDEGKKKTDKLLKKGPDAIVRYILKNGNTDDVGSDSASILRDASNNDVAVHVGDEYLDPEDVIEICRRVR